MMLRSVKTQFLQKIYLSFSVDVHFAMYLTLYIDFVMQLLERQNNAFMFKASCSLYIRGCICIMISSTKEKQILVLQNIHDIALMVTSH